MVTLETDRLTLRMLRESDFDAYAEMCADPEVMRYVGDGQPMARPMAWRSLAMMVGHWSLRGYGLWAAEERASRILIGRIGFWNPEGWPGFELGWMLRRSFWGMGYATEGAWATLQFAFTQLMQQQVISLIHPENASSIRVAERLGERRHNCTELMGKPALVYRITREEWAVGSEQSSPPPLYSVRRGKPEDAPGVLDCLRAAFDPYREQYTPAAYEDTVLTPTTIAERFAAMAVFLAVTAGGEVVGTVACNVVGNGEGHLRGMAVRPNWQGRGVAEDLLAAAESELRCAGCNRVTLNTTRHLGRAIRFYEVHGFRASGTVSNFFGMELVEYVKAPSEADVAPTLNDLG